VTPERWAAAQALFERALVQPLNDREAFLAGECGDDHALATLVRSLLEADASDTGADLQAAVAGAMAGLAAAADALPFERLGPYRLVSVIGRGGMGTVYLAERDDRAFEQRVAIKVVRGLLDAERIRRFRSERQILATLDHPNIARLLDGGATPEGSPYLVMEYVDGQPVDRHCESLPLRERLALVATICGAVGHAHRHLVVHRDLKPSNILVTAAGVPKLLDFGIAKLLDDDERGTGSVTMTGERVLTPEYAAPEQVRGERITTAADVYALGVLLFRLLTGRLPYVFNSRAARDVERVIIEVEPLRPGSLVPLDADLDVITLTALHKDPAQRYISVAALADDLRRYLNGLPIEARPTTWRYRAGRFVARHRWGVAATATAALALVAFSAVVSVQAARIAAERDAAERERDTAAEVSEFLVQLFEVSDPSQARGNSVTARELLDRGADRIERELAAQPLVQSRLMHTIGEVYRTLGLFDRSEAVLSAALAVRRATGADSLQVAATLQELGELAREQGRYELADQRQREALAIREQRLGPSAPEVAYSLNSLGLALSARGRYQEAEPYLTRAIAIWRETLPPGDPQVAVALNNLALLLRRTSRFAEAEPLQREALEIRRRAFTGPHPLTSNSLMQLGQLLQEIGDLGAAEPLMRESMAMRLKLFDPLHPQLAVAYNNLAALLHDQGKLAEAEGIYREAVRVAEARFGTGHAEYAVNLNNLASLLEDRGAYDESERLFRTALAIRQQAFAGEHPSVARGVNNLGRVLAMRGNVAEAAPLSERALAMRRKLLGEQHVEVAGSLATQALVRTRQGRLAEAEQLYRDQLSMLQALLPPDHPNIATARVALGTTLHELGRAAEAEPLLRQGLATREALPAGHWHRAIAQCRLGQALADLGQADGAPLIAKGRAGLVAVLGATDERVAACR